MTSSTGEGALPTPTKGPREVLRLDLEGVGESDGSIPKVEKGEYVVRTACAARDNGSASVKITLKLDAPKGSGEVSITKTVVRTCDQKVTLDGLIAGVDGYTVSLRAETTDASVTGYAILDRQPLP